MTFIRKKLNERFGFKKKGGILISDFGFRISEVWY